MIYYNEESKNLIKEGVNILANAVKVTLGPKGRNVMIKTPNNVTKLTKDGVTVAKAVYSDDPDVNAAISAIKQVAIKTNVDLGDGTTTSTVLAQSIFNNGLKALKNARGVNPIAINKGIFVTRDKILEYIEKLSKPISYGDKDLIKLVASISSNGDSEISSIVSDVFTSAGEYGIINVEKSVNGVTTVSQETGFKLRHGFMSAYFINQLDKNICVLENARLLVFNSKINDINYIKDAMVDCHKQGIPLAIFTQEIENEILNTIIKNVKQHGAKMVVVKLPGYSNLAKNNVVDLCTLTGAKQLNYDTDYVSIEESLGYCEKIIVGLKDTIVNGGRGDKKAIKAKVTSLKKAIRSDAEEKTILLDRLNNYIGKIYTIYVGGDSELEINEKLDRYDDTLGAVRAAVEKGIVPGAGVTYIKALSNVHLSFDNEAERIGCNILKESLLQPFTQILLNAGYNQKYIDNVIEKINNNDYVTLNVNSGKLSHMEDNGVIDSTKVVEMALRNAVSISGLLLTTEVVIGENASEINRI